MRRSMPHDLRRGGRPHRARLARHLRAARRAARGAAALEPRSEDRHRGAARVRQAARLPRPRPGRRHQVPVGAQPPPAPRDARAGLRAHRASAPTSTTIAEQLDSWFLACPYGYGPNWSSALEAALRLINWSAAWQLLGGETPLRGEEHADFRDRWLEVGLPAREFIRGWLSLHSSANNHLIGEAAGLFVAGARLAALAARAAGWPPARRSSSARRWRRTRPTA